MATLNLGRLKPVFRSTWNSATAYNVDDIVVRNNQSYISIQAGTNQDPATATAYWTLMAAKGSDGTDVGATLANKEIAFKTNAGAVDGIPIGNAGEFLKVNSGATGYEFGAVSSDFVKIATHTISSGVNEVIFDNVFTSTYRNYKFIIDNLNFSVTNNNMRVNLRTGGASGSDDTSFNFYGGRLGVVVSSGSDSGSDSHLWGTSDFYLDGGNDITSTSGQTTSHELLITAPNVAVNTALTSIYSVNYSNYSQIRIGVNSAHAYSSTQFTGIKFKIQNSSNTITAGTFNLYGYK